jgi:GntR family transcriptional repressor for pyruvate dehydrogenase complex
MKQFGDGIPGDVLKGIFPDKLSAQRASDTVYTQLKEMILSGKLEKGQRLLRPEFLQSFGINEGTLSRAFSRLKKDGLLIIKGGGGSFVA